MPQLITGPAGCGKTAYVLDRLRLALKTGNRAVRLLVPTATLARHLQNRIAREGFVLRRGLIQTLSGFVEDFAAEAALASDAVLYLIVEEAVRRVNREEFARVAHMPGFCASLARTIEEFASAGCDSARLEKAGVEAPLATAFVAVYREVDRELARRGLVLRAARLERAARRIAAEGLGGIETVWLDGFHALPDPELELIAALTRHAEVALTLPETGLAGGLRERLSSLGFHEQRLARVRSSPALALVAAPGIEREAEEISRMILEQAAAGRPFHEMGIVVRTAETYVPVLRSALERFGIPACFYFDERLDEHAAVRFLTVAVDSMLGGWDHAKTLEVLRGAPRFAVSNGMDRFDFAVREQLPNAGLGGLKKLAEENGSDKLLPLMDHLASLEEWRSFVLAPKDWAARLSTLRNLFRPNVAQVAEPHTREMALEWRRQAAALGQFAKTLEEAAAALDPAVEIPLEPFWKAVNSALRLTPLRMDDGRRNVVHVLSAPEARQWVLPIVFVCGMVEKQFPRPHRQDAFFPDAARCRLAAAGIRVRTAAEFEREERELFEAALTRATMLVSLSYPEFDARGERNLPSIFLEDLLLPARPARVVRPQPRFASGPAPLAPIGAPGLLRVLGEKTARLSPTALEMYLQCGFQYFIQRTLRLAKAPPRPAERLDFAVQGTIVHEVLARWWPDPEQSIAGLFESVFERLCEEKRIPTAYHTERLRNAMLDDLRAFAAHSEWPRALFQSRTEEKFSFVLDDGLEIYGRIDRLDVAADGRAYVIDYKYSNSQNTRRKLTDELLLQAPLYLMGAERTLGVKPSGMFYVGLKGGVVYAGWSEEPMLESSPFPEGWFDRTRERTVQAVAEIRAGRVEVRPANPEHCRYCDSRDICRVEAARAEAALAEGA
jgi:ATP-dependent helicase/DNAse subunit B